MKNILLSAVTISILTFGLTGCGGGDSSDTTTSLSFPTNAIAAEATQENADTVAETVVVNDPSETIGSIGLNSISSSSTTNPQLAYQLFNQINNNLKELNTQTYALNETVNESYPCNDSGTMSVSGSGSETGGYTLTASYNKCSEYSTIMNGSMTITAANYNTNYYTYENMRIKFNNQFSMSTSGIEYSISAGSYINMTINSFNSSYYEPSDFDIDTSYIISFNGMKFGLENCQFNYNADYINDTLTYTQTQGRIYIGNELEGYVDIDTSYTPSVQFIYTSATLTSGVGHYLMADNTPLTITATGGGNYTTTIGTSE